jgi:hypothetical protein
MFYRKTLFILGAGASTEIGLPLGGGLASVIASKMDVRFEMGHRPIGTGDFDFILVSAPSMTRRHPNI